MKLASSTTITVREDLLSSNLSDNEIVMMDIDKGAYYGVSNVAKVIWENLSPSKTLGELHKVVENNFDADAEVIEKDVTEFVTQLADAGLVELN